jgi:hypothetical protein
LVISERDATMVLYRGPLEIDYIDAGWRPGYRVKTSGGGSFC